MQSLFHRGELNDPNGKLFLHYGDITDSGQLTNLIYNIQPDDVLIRSQTSFNLHFYSHNGNYITKNP